MMENWQGWQLSRPQDFWGEIAPCEHVLQIYENHEAFLSTLTSFVGDGINSNDCSIVIATTKHLDLLRARLTAYGVNVDSLIKEDQYIPLDAEQTLHHFMRNDWPDETLFFELVSGLLERGKLKNRKVRAFGEMVALLWAQGNNGATVHLEHLWSQFCNQKDITLYCAYPKSGFTEDAEKSIRHICASHSRVISGKSADDQKILYKNTEFLRV